MAELFGVGRIDVGWQPRYNIAPMQMVPVIRREGEVRTLALMRWGLVPHWADDPAIGNRMINARCESVETKPAFRQAIASRRCIVPADGFYEWRKVGRGKQPMAIVGDGPLALAGLWERWRPRDQADAPWLETCTLLTCEPNALLRDVHDRMPVVLKREDVGRWLESKDSGEIRELMRPYPKERLRMYPVGKRVNSPGNDDASCIEEAVDEPPEPQGALF